MNENENNNKLRSDNSTEAKRPKREYDDFFYADDCLFIFDPKQTDTSFNSTVDTLTSLSIFILDV